MKTARIKIVNVRPKLKLVDGQPDVVRLPKFEGNAAEAMAELFTLIADYGVVGYGFAVCHEDGTSSTGFNVSRHGSCAAVSGALERAKHKIQRHLDEAS